jgi:hypothetical protein
MRRIGTAIVYQLRSQRSLGASGARAARTVRSTSRQGRCRAWRCSLPRPTWRTFRFLSGSRFFGWGTINVGGWHLTRNRCSLLICGLWLVRPQKVTRRSPSSMLAIWSGSVSARPGLRSCIRGTNDVVKLWKSRRAVLWTLLRQWSALCPARHALCSLQETRPLRALFDNMLRNSRNDQL